MKQEEFAPEGVVGCKYESVWAELVSAARTVIEPKPYLQQFKDKLDFNSVIFTSPDGEPRTSSLNIWPYDQHKYPELYGFALGSGKCASFSPINVSNR